jgi:dynein heavy chain
MGKLYSLINQTEFKKCKEHSKYKKFLFSLTWLHSVLLERRKFKTLGFNTPYDFNDSDFLICHDLLIVLLDEYPDNTPFKALQYLIGDANYGGRVTDEWDRKLLGVYMQMFFCEDALSKDRFLLSDVSEYFIPPDGDLASYKSFIDSLPSFDDPAAFGQHPNAEISSQIEDVNNLLETVSSLRSGRSTINTNNDNVGEQIIAKLHGIPDLFSDDRVQSYVQKTSDSSAMQTFLLQEIQRYNSLLALLQKMKDDLDKALKGLIMLTPELENIMENLTNFKVPTEWLQFYPSLKPLDSWLNDLRERVKQLDEWIDNKAPTVFWLSGFTYPSSFITSVLQTTARAKGCAIDSLSWEFEVMTTEKEIKEQPDEGVYISGLFLEGAQWDDDNGHLKEPLPMLMQSQMPIIHFKPIEMRKRSKDEMYHCPIYAYPLRAGTPQRPSYVLTVDLHRGNKSADHWTKRGVAMLLSTAE